MTPCPSSHILIYVYLQEINNTFKKVVTLLGEALANPDPTPVINDPSVPPPMSHTMMDLAIIMIPFLDIPSAELLFNGVTSALLGKEDEPLLQKKAYKVINHLSSCEIGVQVLQKNIENLQNRVLEGTVTCAPSSKKDRIKALGNIVSILPTNDLHLIPSILSEAVMATKEVNEKTRGFAFNLLVEMGNKMKEGGTVVNSKIQGMDEDVPDADANITEYFTMVTAGLAGSTAHMISATVTSLSRLFFEFKESLPQPLLFELMQTMEVFVNSNNREIVKSALGFVKVAIVTLDSTIIGQHLPQLVKSLLNCNKQHKSHFKSKVRHIFERLIRSFGYELVAENVPEDDKKLVLNIKKRRDRSKRAKNANREEDDEEMETAPRQARVAKTGADAYEEAVYGSESEIEDSDEDEAMQGTRESGRNADRKTKKEKYVTEAYIREDGDGPLDFLDRTAISRISCKSIVLNLLTNFIFNCKCLFFSLQRLNHSRDLWHRKQHPELELSKLVKMESLLSTTQIMKLAAMKLQQTTMKLKIIICKLRTVPMASREVNETRSSGRREVMRTVCSTTR